MSFKLLRGGLSAITLSLSLPCIAGMSVETPLPNADGKIEPVVVDIPLLTVCSETEIHRAQSWQKQCQRLDTVDTERCSGWSYARFCQPTTLEEIRVFKYRRLSPELRNIFMRQDAP